MRFAQNHPYGNVDSTPGSPVTQRRGGTKALRHLYNVHPASTCLLPFSLHQNTVSGSEHNFPPAAVPRLWWGHSQVKMAERRLGRTGGRCSGEPDVLLSPSWDIAFCYVLYSFLLLRKAWKGPELLQPPSHHEGKAKRSAET